MAWRHTWTAVLVFAACSDRELATPEESESTGDQANDENATSSQDATAEAEGGPPPAVPDNTYPVCDPEGSYEQCAPSVDQQMIAVWRVEGDSAEYCDGKPCNACLCAISCFEEGKQHSPDPSVCPIPLSGTARPVCPGAPGEIRSCWLSCDLGESCPDGMSCVFLPDFQPRVCAWLSD